MWRQRIASEIELQRALLRTRAGRRLAAGLAALAFVTLIGLIWLWPSGGGARVDASQIIISTGIVPAKVTAVAEANCPIETRPGCQRVDFRLDGGPREGAPSFLILPGDDATPRLSPGDAIRVTPNTETFGDLAPEPAAGADPAQAPYGFVDFERRASLGWLALVFAVLVVVLGRRVGFLSLVGLGVGLLLITAFIVPAILEGSSPFAVALIGSFAAMFATIVLVYGIGAKSLAALMGTAVSLVATTLLAVLFVKLAHITGTSSEEATLVRNLSAGGVSLQGLVLAGILIATLGVLNDVTVGQASTVLALRRANPAQKLAELYRAAMLVGRDHLGATVNTLVFAYAGASLPLLLIFSSQQIGFGDGINREVVATEVVAALVGSIGLVLAVPLTTIAAALMAVRLPADVLPADDHGHHH
ncbi:MAG: YibE/F family protein [Solirubrobacteraceae bacterium]|nr:YibE/F family protein [Solirubrobacteraceae bacterium]